MKNVLILCKATGQSIAFKRDAEQYANSNDNVSWLFADENSYVDKLEENEVYCVGISPEMMLVESKIKADLDERDVKHFSIKPADFGLRRIDKIVDAVEAL